MFFCEKCNLANKETVCYNCGRKKLREVKPDDFCHFANLDAFKTNMLELNFKEKGIPMAKLGYGYNYSTKISSNYKIYVPYNFLNQAEEMYNLLFK